MHHTGIRDLRVAKVQRVEFREGGLHILQEFPRLSRLSLLGEFTDTGMLHVVQITTLEQLVLIGCEEITDIGLQHLSSSTAPSSRFPNHRRWCCSPLVPFRLSFADAANSPIQFAEHIASPIEVDRFGSDIAQQIATEISWGFTC